MDITKYPYFFYDDLIDQTLKPLSSQTEISFFSFRRRFLNFEQFCIFRAREFTIDYYTKELYKFGYFENEPKTYVSSFHMWDHLFGPSRLIYQFMRQEYSISHGLTITQQYGSHFDIFSFGAPLHNSEVNNFYINKKDIFLHFIEDFYLQTESVMGNLSHHKFCFPGDLVNQKSVVDVLSPRQKECGKLMVSGLTAKEIARILNLSPRTVEDHINQLKVKFGAKNRAQLTYLLSEFI